MSRIKPPNVSRKHWDLWKFAQELKLEEISMLIVKRKNELKYSKNNQDIKNLKEEIGVLNEAYKLVKRRKE